VVRNRIKRRVREAVRFALDRLNPQWSIVINPRKKAFDAPEARERFAGQGAVLPLGPPEAFGAHAAAETERWGALIRRSGIKVE